MPNPINENTPDKAISINVLEPACDPFTGEWAYQEREYDLSKAGIEITTNNKGEAVLTVYGRNTSVDIPITD